MTILNFAFANHDTLSDDTHEYNFDDQTLLSQTGVTVKLFDYTNFANHDTLSDDTHEYNFNDPSLLRYTFVKVKFDNRTLFLSVIRKCIMVCKSKV